MSFMGAIYSEFVRVSTKKPMREFPHRLPRFCSRSTRRTAPHPLPLHFTHDFPHIPVEVTFEHKVVRHLFRREDFCNVIEEPSARFDGWVGHVSQIIDHLLELLVRGILTPKPGKLIEESVSFLVEIRKLSPVFVVADKESQRGLLVKLQDLHHPQLLVLFQPLGCPWGHRHLVLGCRCSHNRGEKHRQKDIPHRIFLSPIRSRMTLTSSSVRSVIDKRASSSLSVRIVTASFRLMAPSGRAEARDSVDGIRYSD